MIAKVRGRVVTPGVFVGGLYTPGIRKEKPAGAIKAGLLQALQEQDVAARVPSGHLVFYKATIASNYSRDSRVAAHESGSDEEIVNTKH